MGNDSFEMLRGEVVSVDYGDSDIESHYNIRIKPLSVIGGPSPGDLITAKPLDTNIKRIPVLGEVVLILKGPTSYSSALGISSTNYYINTLAVQNNINHNGLPNVAKMQDVNTSEFTNQSAGVQVKSKDHYFSETWDKDININPLQPFAGDLLIEGRFGNSVRMSSTVSNDDIYSREPNWYKGPGKDNDPIMILANGRKKTSPFGQFITEDIENDLTSIYMTSTQQLKFKPKATKFGAIQRNSINSYQTDKHQFSGSQIGFFSRGRIIMNTDEKEIILMSGGGFGVSSNKSICFDTTQTFEIGNARRINLGLDANEPALLGDTSGDWLSDLLTQMQNLCVQLSTEIHGTGVGPSTPPANAAEYVRLQSEFQRLQAEIPKLKSRLVYVGKNPK